MARQFASLDHLSGGRAAWNVVTSWDAFTGENFRRGGFLPQDDRYERAKTFLRTTWELFDSWRGDEIVADKESGVFLADPDAGAFAHTDAHFDIPGQFNVPRSPQGRPVIFQAGDSDEGREFAAASADAIFSRHGTLEDGQAFYADVKGRLARYGRAPDQLLILPAATFVLGDTDAEAAEIAREVRLPAGQRADRDQVRSSSCGTGTCPATTRTARCPRSTRSLGENTIARGRASVRMYRDPMATAGPVARAQAEAENLSIRELIVEVTGRQSFIGSATTVADDDRPPRAGRRQRRVHPGPAHHPGRAGRVRRHRGPAAAGTRGVPHRVRRAHAARSPGPGSAAPPDAASGRRPDRAVAP